jgi:ribosomal protein S18 acetylase RimI-like enzyme
VGLLGVRKPWRKRGLGKALLVHAFREFRDRGYDRATLGVDSENPTGATRLYESVGMHVETTFVTFEKELA